MKLEVTPKMEFWSITLGLFSGFISLCWIGYLVYEKFVITPKKDANLPK